MENLCTILKLLFKEVSARDILENRISYDDFGEKPFMELVLAHEENYSGNDAKNLYCYLQDVLRQERGNLPREEGKDGVSVLETLRKFNKMILKEIQEIPVCRYRYLLKWRMVSFALEEELFTTSFLAERDFDRQRELRKRFGWKYIIHSDNVELNNMLNQGLADNHFHLKGSAPYFYMSWINLMNYVNEKKFIRTLRKYDENRQQEFALYHTKAAEESLVVMHLQAALIRAYLYSWLVGRPFNIREYNFVPYAMVETAMDWNAFDDENDISKLLEAAKERCRERARYDVVWADQMIWEYLHGENGEEGKRREHSEMRRKWEWICDRLLHNVEAKELTGGRGRITERSLARSCFMLHPMVDCGWEFVQMFIDWRQREEINERVAFEQAWQLLRDSKQLLWSRDRLQSEIENLRIEGRVLDVGKIFDYMQGGACTEEDLYGERWFLYRMFRKLYEGDRGAAERGNLFYAYLVMKERIRAEMIQVNDKVGFENFLRYQNRKEEFIDDTALSKIYSKHAVVSSFNGQALRMLEARITPRNTAKENKMYIDKLDREILGRTGSSDQKFFDGKYLDKKDFFYVFHFVKEPDPNLDKNLNVFECRHYKLRKKVRRQAMGIYYFRERYAETAARLYGIDACSPEIGCRPEVFAQAFRYLKGEQNFSGGVCPEIERPRLRSTYHAGEDFLDIVDGMRAIDEAIYFLNMTHGDRLGHALALGISPREWYHFKTHRVLCPKQDVLDNIVWIHQKIRKYDIHDTEAILMKLQRTFVHLYQEIYRSGPNADRPECDIDLYYDAWKLRGDNPELYYEAGEDEGELQILCGWDVYARNIKYPELDKIRRERRCRELYHWYHYDDVVKRQGNVVMELKVEQDIVRVVEKIQYHLQREILERGLAIEANPSSNYLIGTFRSYDRHPIVGWYNKGLTSDREELEKCPQLDVTINTDDQAVFGTSLENEFALMAVALEKAVDEEGNLKYKKDMIYDWLNHIREKGFTRCFKQPGREEEAMIEEAVL